MSLTLDVAHRYEDFRLAVSFEARPRGVTALFGPSGCGKTTVINVIAGLLTPEHGRVQMDERVLLDTAAGVNLSPRRRRMGYVFQGARLFPHLSVKGNLFYGFKRARTRPSDDDCQQIIEALDITRLLERRPSSLSGGERQRVAIGRALLTAPACLLLDEPLSGLDHKRRDDILPYLERLRDERGVPMIYVSHSVDEVTRLADDVLVMDDGAVVAAGSVTEVFSRIDLFPLTGRFEAGAVIAGRVLERLQDYGLSRIEFEGGTLTIPGTGTAVGSTVRVRIRARDVMLSTAPPPSSVNNVLVVEIQDIRRDPGPFADVQLGCGRTRLVARVTRLALARLALERGQRAYAMFKTVAIDQRAGSGSTKA